MCIMTNREGTKFTSLVKTVGKINQVHLVPLMYNLDINVNGYQIGHGVNRITVFAPSILTDTHEQTATSDQGINCLPLNHQNFDTLECNKMDLFNCCIIMVRRQDVLQRCPNIRINMTDGVTKIEDFI